MKALPRSVAVTSPVIAEVFPEDFRRLTRPELERRDGGSCFPDGLRQRAVPNMELAQDGLPRVPFSLESIAVMDVRDAVVSPFDHTVCLWPHRVCEAVVDASSAQSRSNAWYPVVTYSGEARQPAGKRLSVINRQPRDYHRGRALLIAQEAACVGRDPRRMDEHADCPHGDAGSRPHGPQDMHDVTRSQFRI